MQKQPNPASCLATAFAMALNIPVEQVFQELGHNGMAIWWPELDDSLKYRAFHNQEMVDLCYEHGWVLTPIEPNPIGTPRIDIQARPFNTQVKAEIRIQAYLDNTRGVLVGEGKTLLGNGSSCGHAAAWIEGMVHDPNGTIYPIDDFGIREFWMMTQK